MTFMWQEERGKPYYKFQTDDKSINKKMKRRGKFTLSAEGINCAVWIYVAIISRPDIARKILKTLSGANPKFDSKADVFYSETKSSGIKKSAA